VEKKEGSRGFIGRLGSCAIKGQLPVRKIETRKVPRRLQREGGQGKTSKESFELAFLSTEVLKVRWGKRSKERRGDTGPPKNEDFMGRDV